MEQNDDPYKILGVHQDASAAEIKKAYRKLALQNHPDKQRSEAERANSSGIFSKIAAAYEILSDDEERKQYDLRKKHGGAPGTRYTTFDDQSFPRKSSGTHGTTYDDPPSTPTGSTTTRTYRSPKKTTEVRKTQSSPGSGTIHFTYDPSKVRTSNPYEIFKEVFGSDFKSAFPETVLSPGKSQRCKSIPVSPLQPTFATLKTPSSSSPRKNHLSVTKWPRQSVTARNDSNDDVVSMSTSTKTICNQDGSHEDITETTITRADGSTNTTTESSRSNTLKQGTRISTTPQVVIPRNKVHMVNQPFNRTYITTSTRK